MQDEMRYPFQFSKGTRYQGSLQKQVLSNTTITFGLPWKHHLLNCPSLSKSSVNQNPMVADCQEIFSQVSGTLASYMASRVARRELLITIVPSIANNRSDRLDRTITQKCLSVLGTLKLLYFLCSFSLIGWGSYTFIL